MSEYYLEDAKRLIQERLWEDKTITWAANHSFPPAPGSRHFGIGYTLLSTERLFSVSFYVKSSIFGIGPKRSMYLPPFSPLTDEELSSRLNDEVLLSQIIGVNRYDSTVKIEGSHETVVGLTISTKTNPIFGIVGIVYNLRDGRYLYKFLNDLLRQSMTNPKEQSSISSSTPLIEALAQLYEAEILTKEEFETKMGKLLSKI